MFVWQENNFFMILKKLFLGIPEKVVRYLLEIKFSKKLAKIE